MQIKCYVVYIYTDNPRYTLILYKGCTLKKDQKKLSNYNYNMYHNRI